MATCVICDFKFYAQDWSSPAEPCDCGACVSRSDWQDMDPAEFARLVDEWQSPATQETT